MSAKGQRAHELFASIETLLRRFYTGLLSARLFVRAWEESWLVTRIQYRLKHSNAVYTTKNG
jgi:hypothetical protein